MPAKKKAVQFLHTSPAPDQVIDCFKIEGRVRLARLTRSIEPVKFDKPRKNQKSLTGSVRVTEAVRIHLVSGSCLPAKIVIPAEVAAKLKLGKDYEILCAITEKKGNENA